MKCNYRNCYYLPSEEGNRRYCDDDCYKAEKSFREKGNYANKKKTFNQIEFAEKILSAAYKKYGSQIINSSIIRAENMDWSIYTGTSLINEVDVNIVGSYGYTLFIDNTIKIYKL